MIRKYDSNLCAWIEPTPADIREAAEALGWTVCETPEDVLKAANSMPNVRESIEKDVLTDYLATLRYTPSPLVDGPPPEDAEDGLYQCNALDGKTCFVMLVEKIGSEWFWGYESRPYDYLMGGVVSHIRLPSAKELRKGAEGNG